MIEYNLIANDLMKTASMVIHGKLRTITSEHPNFAEVIGELLKPEASEDRVSELLDIEKAINKTFEKISDRISIKNGEVYLDNDPLNNTLFDAILQAHKEENREDAETLAFFFENLAENPSTDSRNQLYDWIAHHGLAITEDGYIYAYKGVREDYRSIHSGKAIINGEEFNGHVPNLVGSQIEMPRSQVTANPGIGCSQGLHAGTFNFANSFKGNDGKILLVIINPRDVVSVPRDSSHQKIRCARYTILEEVVYPLSEGLVPRRTEKQTLYEDQTTYAFGNVSNEDNSNYYFDTHQFDDDDYDL